jgi:hypothetical protein
MLVFSDERKGLFDEALVGGVPEIFEAVASSRGFSIAGDGCVAAFSTSKFPMSFRATLRGPEGSGYLYTVGEEGPAAGMQGWLCESLLQYFDSPPQDLWFDVRSPKPRSFLDSGC